ncbi:Serine--tRNA ligase [Paenibacillus allorhizoplanae]|uniref:Serine--tRNA ligase n=1 Tax=Paenibacillus allorhizoplanae TaxID=2905648 RepID=A0ABN8G9E7_9BACL|nr:serine--tRNA ligase [Paenibacillus allorhizoplanae]CAH1199645.1 Serine--tRNA ligase [Paenibacillus allorhizoplanae]
MLDIKWIRNNQDQVKAAAFRKGVECHVEELLVVDEKKRGLLGQADLLRADRNRVSEQIASLMMQRKTTEAEGLKEQVRGWNQRLAALEAELNEYELRFKELMLQIPNLASPDTPIGKSDQENVEIKVIGDKPIFNFEMKDHLQLGEALNMIDVGRGVKIAGSRNYYLKGMGLYLHRAVQQLAIDLLTDRGFTVMDVPLMVREETLLNAAFFPAGKDQTYELPADNTWLVGTSEGPLISYYAGEIVDLTEGPIQLAAVSNCFRKEAGSAGRDVRGLYRVHQFAKVEQVILCENNADEADRMLQLITQNAEDLLACLELPYRVVAVCSGDMGAKNYKQFDIETWMPSRGAYGETHSSSSLLDFQARRSNLRYRDQEGVLRYCYTLNNTAVASPRILIPLLENHQQADGSIYIPPALRPYMRGLEAIRV